MTSTTTTETCPITIPTRKIPQLFVGQWKEIYLSRINILSSASFRQMILCIAFLLAATKVEAFQYTTTTTKSHANFNTISSGGNSHLLKHARQKWMHTSSTCLNERATRMDQNKGYKVQVGNRSIGQSPSQSSPRVKELQSIHDEIRRRISNKDLEINNSQIRQLVDKMILIAKSDLEAPSSSSPSSLSTVETKTKQQNATRSGRKEDQIIQDSCRLITQRAFSSSSWPHVKLGLAIMERQAHYKGIPPSVCIQALKALNVLMTSRRNWKNGNSLEKDRRLQVNAAFRILQRMCSGVGINTQSRPSGAATATESAQISNNAKNRRPARPSAAAGTNTSIDLDERDFSMVLNGFVNIGEMTMAHRVVALQSRTPHAPPLSPVIYSILIKGYGRLKNGDAVDMVKKEAEKRGVKPDIIMCNSLMDAYINCDDVEKAYAIFSDLTRADSKKNEKLRDVEKEEERLTPNLRTYNTMLKGFVKSQNMKKALSLTKQMESVKMWDAVTTNTLVGVAVATKNFEIADSILEKYTVQQRSETVNASGQRHHHRQRHQRWHPNVEAYTELIDGYAKNGRLTKALETFKIMRLRGVNPNEYTYTCIIGGLAKAQKFDKANNLLSAMVESDNIQPGVVTYNALLTGMLMSETIENYITGGVHPRNQDDEVYKSFDESNNNALQLFGTMINAGVKPNAVTIATLVDGLGKNKPSRLDQAKALVAKMDSDGYVSKSNVRVSTTLIHACTRANDLEGALKAYRRIEKPDVIAFNALLSGFCDCSRAKMAVNILDANLKKKLKGMDFVNPDVATYTILISALLGIGTPGASERSYKLYKEMKDEWKIIPDPCLIDS